MFDIALTVVRRFLAAAAVIGASLISTVQPAVSQPLDGNYQCTGKNRNGAILQEKLIYQKEGRDIS